MPDTKPANPPQLETFRSNEFTKVYANSANVEVTPWDFRLLFGELTRMENGVTKVEETVSVVMSPQHAKALLGVLQNNIREYEKHVGEIKLPQAPDSATQPSASQVAANPK